jgi:WD40 repeat protein
MRVGDRADLLVWQPNGTTLAVVHGSDLLLYNGDTGALLQTLTGHNGLIRSCAWNLDGDRLATTCRDAVLRIWDTQAGTLLKALAVNDLQEKLGIVSWSPDGRFLAYSTELQPSPQAVPDAQPATITSVVRALDASSFALVHELRGHLGAVRVMSWRPSGDLLASISNDKAIVWDTHLGKQRFMVERSSLQISDTAYSPDGRKLWSTGDDRIVRLWEAESGAEFQQIAGHKGQVTCVAWHPNSSSIAIGRSDGVVVIVPQEESLQQIAKQEHV